MRGKLAYKRLKRVRPRITPADAGKPTFMPVAKNDAADHPRGCGENGGGGTPIRPPKGSPPRMRGKLSVVTPVMPEAGITPADAGKTAL